MTAICPEIAHVCISRREAVTEDGQVLPVTKAGDRFGDECDLAEADFCIAGPDRDGNWLTIDFAEMERTRAH